jgi:ADP-ribose pyrophosphatase YjhB (NUDIX family)
VAALMLLDGKVVTVRHQYEDQVYHLLPGGGVDYGETLAAAVSREVREETGLEITVGDVLFVNDTIDPLGTRHVVNITFDATIAGGTLSGVSEDPRVVGVDLVHPADLLSFDFRPPIAEAIVTWLRSEGTVPSERYLGSLFTQDA